MTDGRRAELAKIHIGKKSLGLDEGSYRDLLQRVTGQRSAGALSEWDRRAVLDEMKRLGFADRRRPPKRAGDRPLADGDMQRKIRALWISLYHLGVVREPSELALAAWVARTAKVEALQWLTPRAANKAIEGLKAMGARAGVDWSAHGDPKRCVADRLWEMLLEAGEIRHADWVTAESYGYRCGLPAGFQFYSGEHWDRLIEILGGKRRKARGATRGR